MRRIARIFKASGEEVVVFCPESKDAAATQRPARRRLRQSEAQPTEPTESAETPPAAQLAHAAPVESAAPQTAVPVTPVTAPTTPAGLKEQHFTTSTETPATATSRSWGHTCWVRRVW